MRIKTSELEGAALDWAVAQVSGARLIIIDMPSGPPHVGLQGRTPDGWPDAYSPSKDWSQGGPLIAEKITCLVETKAGCHADTWADAGAYGQNLSEFDGHGPTMLVAAMRAIVASELGDEVEVPAELGEG